jgi:hypothetical protein
VNKNSGDIRGRAWRVEDKKCYNGTWRTALFIHSEQYHNPSNSQHSSIEKWKWDGNNDYYSNGCVKLSHAHISNGEPDGAGTAARYWDTKSRLNAVTNVLYVKS